MLRFRDRPNRMNVKKYAVPRTAGDNQAYQIIDWKSIT